MVMNNGKSLFGVVDKQIPKKDYIGASTSTADVTVDNELREISVDVKFYPDLLGDKPGTAYPGELGAQTRRLLSELDTKVSSEVERAQTAEQSIKDSIAIEFSKTVISDANLRNYFDGELNEIHTDYATKTYVYKQFEELSKLSKQIADSVDIENSLVTIKGEVIVPVDGVVYLVKTTSASGEDVYKQYTLVQGNLTLIGDTTVDLTDYAKIEYVDQTKKSLKKDIQVVDKKFDNVSAEFDIVDATIEDIKRTYATKQYVGDEIVNYSKLSKKIADSVDTVRNKVIIEGVEIDPVEGYVYLIKELTNDGEDSYAQYTTIEGSLTLIGGTSIDLIDYATKSFVESKIDSIPEVDLTDYAKKSELPDVSQFISSIPSEYVTEDELSPYATKSYVQTELSKVGSLTKQIVDAIDIKNKTVTIDGVTTSVKPDTIYLVKKQDVNGAYAQYIIIDNQLTWIGDTDVSLDGYATKTYVDGKIDTVLSILDGQASTLRKDFEDLLLGIKFLDGGTSSSIII